jgi:prepilin-type N-terminal cleavage/methylation domain-containing protein
MIILLQRRDSRSAMTLVEVMVAVAVTSILAGVVVSLLIGLRDWDRSMRRRSVYTEQLARLGETLRSDIRQATDVTLPTTDALLIHGPNEMQIRYELVTDGCRRMATTPADAMPRTDAFSVGPTTSWMLAPGSSGRLPLFAVTLNRGTENNKVGLAPLVVYAAAGADAEP